MAACVTRVSGGLGGSVRLEGPLVEIGQYEPVEEAGSVSSVSNGKPLKGLSISLLDSDGNPISGDGIVANRKGIAIDKTGAGKEDLAIASNGTDYLVVWDDVGDGRRAIYGCHISYIITYY